MLTNSALLADLSLPQYADFLAHFTPSLLWMGLYYSVLKAWCVSYVPKKGASCIGMPRATDQAALLDTLGMRTGRLQSVGSL